MLDWGSVEPADIRCPTLWLSGTRNENTMASIEQYAAALREPNCLVQVETVAGLNHQEEFAQIDDVLPLLLKFTED